MQDETISVGPFVLERADGSALLNAVKWGAPSIVHGWFDLTLRAMGFVFLGYLVARVTLTSLTGYMSASAFHQARFVPIVAAGFLAMVYEFLVTPYVRSRFIFRQKLHKRSQSIVISSEGVSSKEGDIKSSVPWLEIDRVAIAPQHIMLFISQVQAIVVPTRAFASRDAAKAFADSALRWHGAAKGS